MLYADTQKKGMRKIRIMGNVVYLTGFGICATVGIVFDMRIRGGERG